MKSKRSQEGYLLIDNRHAPGPSAEEAARLGKPLLGSGSGMFETAAATCNHCRRVMDLRGDLARVGYCRKCDHYTCDSPACVECRPMNQFLDQAQERAFQLLRG